MSQVIEEITKLYPVEVDQVYVPHSAEEISEILKNSQGKVAIGGGRYSMGGQTAILGGVQIDMRAMNKIVSFSKLEKTITVEAGIRWRDVQEYIDPYDLSVMTMQTYSNFTVGGSLSVNCHGRYRGFGPIILSVLSLKVVLANGDIVLTSPTEKSDIFFATIGGYGGVSIILEATLKLKENIPLERVYTDMLIGEYADFFKNTIRDNSDVVFHNGDIYPPHYSKVRATIWIKTDKLPTPNERLIPRDQRYTLAQGIYRIMKMGNIGKWFREYIIDPLLYKTKPVHNRNYEASYDVAELEPTSRNENSYVLEEYFCPVSRFDEFITQMGAIFTRHQVNVLNVSIRHALPDSGSLLAWASQEVFAFVVYYNQKTTLSARGEVAVWTRELIDAVISMGGRYYLPYQLHGTLSQLKMAYPRWDEYANIKKKYDPDGRLSNSLLEKYYFASDAIRSILPSRFQTIYSDKIWRDRFYIFLQNIFHIAPTAEFHSALWEITKSYHTDKEIYEAIQQKLSTIKPFLADIRYGIPALLFQKNEIVREMGELLNQKKFTGYLEVGGAGRYIQPMCRKFRINGPIYLLSDEPIDFAPTRILERERIGKYHTKPLTYRPSDIDHIPEGSLELITVFIGLHHSPQECLDDFFRSLLSKLKKGGSIVIRDHDVRDAWMHTFVSLAHDIYNAGTGAPWETNKGELRHFRSTDAWKLYFASFGLSMSEKSILQKHDPTDNRLMCLTK